MRKLIIDGNAVYELDENCMLKKKLSEKQNEGEKRICKTKKRKNKTHNIKYYLCNLDKKMMMLS